MKFNHLNLCVDNLADARKLFEDLFDLQCVEQKKDALAIMTDGQGFTLVLSRLNDAPISYPQGFHVGFLVDTPGQVDSVYQRVAAADVSLDHAPRRIRESYTFYFTALSSILFEVSCPIE